MLSTSEQGISLIKKYEGFSAEAYLCPAGKPTIGYGHVIQSGEKFPALISEAAAGLLLRRDVAFAERAVNGLVRTDLKQHEFDALVSFTFNLGEKALENSTLLRLINELNMGAAYKQFSRWVYANGRKLDGLVRRRQAEADMFSGIALI